MREGDDAIDVGEFGFEAVVTKMICDVSRNTRRAIHARDDGDVIARADFAASTRETRKLNGSVWFGQIFRIDTPRVVAGEILHPQIVSVHVLADEDVARREAKGLSVFLYRLTRRDVAQGYFVTDGDIGRDYELGGSVGQDLPLI